MIMRSEDSKKYVDLFYWIFYTISAIPYNKPNVYKAFVNYSPTSFIYSLYSPFHTLQWGSLPYLRVNSTDMMECKDDGEEKIGDNLYVMRRSLHWYGFTVPTQNIDEIYIASDLAALAGTPEEIVLEATVLHELIHWQRKKAGQDVYEETAPYAFEKEAYGKTVLRTWKTCFEQPYFKIK